MEAGGFSTVGQDKTYVRKANDDQVWLVKGGLVVDEEAGDWVTEEILNIDASRVKKVEIIQKSGEHLLQMINDLLDICGGHFPAL